MLVDITQKQYWALEQRALAAYCQRLADELHARASLRGKVYMGAAELGGLVMQARRWGITDEREVGDLAELAVLGRDPGFRNPDMQATLGHPSNPSWLKLMQLKKLVTPA